MFISAKIVYVVRLHHSEHQVTQHMILPTVKKTTERKRKNRKSLIVYL